MKPIRLALAVAACACLLNASATAQFEQNLPEIDRKRFTYGLQFGAFYSMLALEKSEAFLTDPDLVAVEPAATGGFSLGVIVNWQLPDEHWDVRMTPNVAFYERTMDFVYRGDSVVTETFETRFLEVPLMFRFKSSRRRNHRLFVTGGVVGGYELGNPRESDEADFVELSQFNFEVAYGFGIDLYLPYIRLAPEVRISHGIPDLLQPAEPGNRFGGALQRVTTHKIALYLNFEG